MELKDKLDTAWFILTKGGDPLRRVRLYRAFRKMNRRWMQAGNYHDRIRDVLASSDNADIPRVPDAGKIINGELIMHNGLKVGELSYYQEGLRDLMIANRGVHEPQEERAYQEVLKWMPDEATMLELGSYWAFYSMWFYRSVPRATCYCVEPDPDHLKMGRENFELNFGAAPPRVTFEHAYLGAREGKAPDGTAVVSVDSLTNRLNIPHLHILHLDTQGAEAEILAGARLALTNRRIDYIFISTHSNHLHLRCLRELETQHYRILADIDLLETYSFDGLIVARRRRRSSVSTDVLLSHPPSSRDLLAEGTIHYR
jgi:hypothetical protein